MKKIIITHEPERYENIFNVYQFDTSNNDTYVFYNIMNKISIPNDLDPNVYQLYRIESQIALTTLSHKLYGSQHFWTSQVNGTMRHIKITTNHYGFCLL